MKQVRFIPLETCGLQLREPQEGQAESRTIQGTPIVFGVRSVNLTPWNTEREVYEVLEPGCITQELLQRSDVILNLNHSTHVTDILGRCRNGKGTLQLALQGGNITCRCDIAKTHNADDALELIRRGDINGMSFAFEDDWEDTENGVSYERTAETHDGKEVWLRHVKRITGLYDVAIVTHPAYEQTSVATREQTADIEAAIEAQLKREQEKPEEKPKNPDQPENPGEQRSDEDKDKDKDEQPADTNDEGKADGSDTQNDDEEEEKERERIAAQHRQRQRARLLNREIEDIFI